MNKYFIYAGSRRRTRSVRYYPSRHNLPSFASSRQQNNLFIVREYTESQSAKEPGRPVFGEMVAQIEQGAASGILAWNPDRLARNSVDGGRIIYLVDTGKITSLKFPTFWFEPTPQGKFMLSVAFGQAKYYTDNLRENILRGIRQKIRRGELSAKAPIGYFNEPRLRTIEPDKNTFNKVKECLEAFATGRYTKTAIRDKMFSLGLVGKNGKSLHLASIQKILTNPFYYGHFRYRGEVHEGSHTPMISKKLFDEIQEALVLNGKPRKKRGDKNFPFLGFAVCGECGYAITGERKVKRNGKLYHYYHCTFKSKAVKCSQTRFVREEVLAAQIRELVQKASLPDEWRDKYLLKLDGETGEARRSSDAFAQNLRTKIAAVKMKIDRLNDGYLSGSFELPEYQETKNRLLSEKKTLDEQLGDFERKGNRWLGLFRNWIIEANQALNLTKQENPIPMKDFLAAIGSNRRLTSGTLVVDFKKPFSYLAGTQERTRSVRDENFVSSEMWTQGESNSRLRNANAA